MAHGMPDDSDVESDSNVSKSLDLAELAVRLGALPSFDRRGDVIYCNDFRAGLGLLAAASSSGGIAQNLCNSNALLSGISLDMLAPNTEDQYANVYFEIVLGQTKSVGIEALYTIAQPAKSISLRMEIIIGGIAYYFAVDVVFATGEVLAYNQAGVWVQVGVHTCLTPDAQWLQSFKLVADLENHRYARLVFNNSTYLLTATLPYVFTVATNDSVLVELRVRSGAGGPAEAYLAGVILTQNEPL